MVRENQRRVLTIGNKLVAGPNAIFRISDGSWLEKDLHFSIYEEGLKKIETYSLWTDDSMNKEENFLSPMIRILTWERRRDLNDLNDNKTRKFPMIDVKLGIIHDDKLEEVNQKFISFQKIVTENNNYIPFKLSTKRDSADIKINYDQEYIDYSIYMRNGAQSFEFCSTGNNSDNLVKGINDFKKLLQESIQVINKSEWKERYYELTEDYIEGEFLEWYYEDNINKKAKS